MMTFKMILRFIRHGLALFAVGCFTASCLLTSDRPEFYRCNSQADCLPDEICELPATYAGAIGTCYPVGYCQYDANCPDGQGCVNERCIAVQCTPDSEEVCQMYQCASTHTCLTSCTSNIDCREFNEVDHHCEAGVCVRDECDYASDCPSNHTCYGGICKKTCASSVECTPPTFCQNFVCL